MSGRDLYKRFDSSLSILRALLGRLPFSIRKVILAPFGIGSGLIGTIARNLLHSTSLQSAGGVLFVAKNVVIKNPQNITVGDNLSIHTFCYLDGFGELSIGNDVSIAHGCSILTTNHRWDDPSIPIKYNPAVASPVSIADDVWIGCGVRILAGTKINSRVVVASGAVVRSEL